MIIIKTLNEIEKMKRAGELTAIALKEVERHIAPGISTYELDRIISKTIRGFGAKPGFYKLYDFPASACISLNSEVIHGIPSKKVILKEGDIVSIDTGAYYDGFHGDAARTFEVGKVSENAHKLTEVTKECFFKGIEKAVIGNRIGDIGAAIEAHALANGFQPVRVFVGHGVGRALHEDPEVPNYGTAGHGVRLEAGMTLAVEPMINEGTHEVYQSDNGWTIFTQDGKLSSHYENTIAITENGPLILTKCDE